MDQVPRHCAKNWIHNMFSWVCLPITKQTFFINNHTPVILTFIRKGQDVEFLFEAFDQIPDEL